MKIDYERYDYAELAKEFDCQFRIGTYGIKFGWHDLPDTKSWKFIQIIPLTGWITEPKEVERIIRERGMEL